MNIRILFAKFKLKFYSFSQFHDVHANYKFEKNEQLLSIEYYFHSTFVSYKALALVNTVSIDSLGFLYGLRTYNY